MTSRLLVIIAATATAMPASAQIRASERGVVSQTVDGTVITIDYARIRARGRDSLFGGVVPWGKVWTGANWATTIDLTSDVTINRHPLPAGIYSVWFDVQPDAWTAIFDPEPRRFHLMPPPESDEQLRFTVQITEVPHTEILTWSFPSISPTGTMLQFAWGTTGIQLDIGVPPSQTFTVAQDFAEPFLGTWRLEHRGLLGSAVTSFTVRYEDDRLKATWEAAPNPHLHELWLVHLGERIFHPVETQDGELWDVLVDVVFEFTPLDGRPDRFEIRGLGDQLMGVATRAP